MLNVIFPNIKMLFKVILIEKMNYLFDTLSALYQLLSVLCYMSHAKNDMRCELFLTRSSVY